MAKGIGYAIKRIAIIGAGPAGVAAAKYLLDEKKFDVVRLFEQRDTVGGVWNYSPFMVGKLDDVPTNGPKENGLPTDDENLADEHAVNLSPMYDQLETNIPNFMMRHSDLPFPAGTPLFPRRELVLQYLKDYAKGVLDLICFRAQVFHVRHEEREDRPIWTLSIKDLRTLATRIDRYDAVIVATGHYNVPYIPDIKGMSAWNQQYPGLISHSKYYRSSDMFQKKKVLVVGNSASGSDISSQICRVCQKPLLISRRRAVPLPTIPEELKQELPEIEEFLLHRRVVKFQDGTTQEDVDAVLFCTGYLYSYPFLSSLQPPVIGDGSRVQHVYRHIFYIHQPTLAFLALPQKIIPFPVCESQAAVVARVWADRLDLPNQGEMFDWETKRLDQTGGGKGFHTLSFPQDANYIEELFQWCLQAKRTLPGVGKIPPVWGQKERWIRSRIPAIKEAYSKLGDQRHSIQMMEPLGFRPEADGKDDEARLDDLSSR